MADSGNSKARSVNASPASSNSTPVLNPKKPSNSKTAASPSKLASSPVKSSSTKSSQPVKPSTPKSSGTKTPTLSSTSPIQKSSPVKSTTVNSKRLGTSTDLKNANEQKIVSGDNVIGKLVTGKITQQNVVDGIIKSKSRSLEKLSESTSVKKSLKTITGESASESLKIHDAKTSTVKRNPTVDEGERIETAKNEPVSIDGDSTKTKPTCTNDCQVGSVDCASENSRSVNNEETNRLHKKLEDNNLGVGEENLSDYVDSSCESCVKSEVNNQLIIKSEVEKEEDFIIVNSVDENEIKLCDSVEEIVIGGISPSDTIKHISFDEKLRNPVLGGKPDDGQSAIKTKTDDSVILEKTIVEKSVACSSSEISSKNYVLGASKSSSDLQGQFISESLLHCDSTVVESHEILLKDLVNNSGACSLSGGLISTAFNSLSEATSNAYAVNPACNFNSSNLKNSNNSIYVEKIDANNSANKGVSDPIPQCGLVAKVSDSSVTDTVKMNGEHIVSETSHKSIENPPYNTQVSSQDNPSAKIDSVPLPPPEESKESIRLKVWDLLEKNNYVLFPRPCKGRIPHFVGSPDAADRLSTLDDFKKAQNVKVNPDKPQAHVRYLTLEAGKNLLVPIPRLRSGLFKRIVPPAGASKEELKTVVTQQGVLNSGEALGFDDKVSIDLVVMGAVAVSKEGHRIGKGEGYADLEFAIMMKMGAITQDTVVVTTVHDEQVFDTLPNHLFMEHDVPVDFIVTPNNVYEVKPRLPKPTGIFWNILSNRRLEMIPILKTLHDKEVAEGNDCPLKEVDSDPEERPMRPYNKFFRRIKSRRDHVKPRNQRPSRESSAPPATPNLRPPQRNRQSRTFRRKPAPARSSSAKEQPMKNAEPGSGYVNKRKQQHMVERVRAGGDGVRSMRRKYIRKPRGPIAFSIRVSGITQGTRVRDLKTALNERGVKPYDITWESNKGLAVLHFSRMEMFKDKKPHIFMDISSVDVVEGFPAKLELKLPANAKAYKYEWCVNGKPINMQGRSKVITRLDGTAGLLINNVNLEDAGEYTVTVKNKHGEITSKGSLNVTAKTKANTPEVAPSFGEEIKEYFVDRNSSLTMSVPISGNPVPDVEWSKEGIVLSQSDSRVQFQCDGSKVELKINQCRIHDAGEYKCKLQNHLGEAEFTTNVIVNTPSRANNQINNIAMMVSIEDITNAMDEIITALQDLRVKGENEEDPKDSLCVEPANSITRIESTGISTV